MSEIVWADTNKSTKKCFVTHSWLTYTLILMFFKLCYKIDILAINTRICTLAIGQITKWATVYLFGFFAIDKKCHIWWFCQNQGKYFWMFSSLVHILAMDKLILYLSQKVIFLMSTYFRYIRHNWLNDIFWAVGWSTKNQLLISSQTSWYFLMQVNTF